MWKPAVQILNNSWCWNAKVRIFFSSLIQDDSKNLLDLKIQNHFNPWLSCWMRVLVKGHCKLCLKLSVGSETYRCNQWALNIYSFFWNVWNSQNTGLRQTKYVAFTDKPKFRLTFPTIKTFQKVLKLPIVFALCAFKHLIKSHLFINRVGKSLILK